MARFGLHRKWRLVEIDAVWIHHEKLTVAVRMDLCDDGRARLRFVLSAWRSIPLIVHNPANARLLFRHSALLSFYARPQLCIHRAFVDCD